MPTLTLPGRGCGALPAATLSGSHNPAATRQIVSPRFFFVGQTDRSHQMIPTAHRRRYAVPTLPFVKPRSGPLPSFPVGPWTFAGTCAPCSIGADSHAPALFSAPDDPGSAASSTGPSGRRPVSARRHAYGFRAPRHWPHRRRLAWHQAPKAPSTAVRAGLRRQLRHAWAIKGVNLTHLGDAAVGGSGDDPALWR